ncbi:MAG: hypothetical protein RBG13Loki_0802 [Promethearchaeota archaeon CR_4]|nr:MAG: hypothetical protein RBG13Loki_0802 [Candidatus Lokiarchaeota archaeon CR_4]
MNEFCPLGDVFRNPPAGTMYLWIQIVEHPNGVSLGNEHIYEVGTDESGAACYKYLFTSHFPNLVDLNRS